MVKIDLITGFLGSGKTTFVKKYARHLIDQGMRIGILENDFGAVNVDMMLLQDLEGEQCGLEMVAGGCDADCHKRRFKTKLIAMGMSGYDRVLVEPSGIFDVDEFFDVLYEEPLCNWYEIGNVIAIVDAGLEDDLSEQSEYLLASQVSEAGCVLISKAQEYSEDVVHTLTAHINRALQKVKCRRQVNKEVLAKDWSSFRPEDWAFIMNCGYVSEDYKKMFLDDEGAYQTLYYMNSSMTEERMNVFLATVMQDETYGKIFRVKGFLKKEDGTWLQINATSNKTEIQEIQRGQEIVIVIGEHLDEEKIASFFK